MNAAVVRAKLKPGSIDKVVELYRDIVLAGYWKVRGARGGQLWVNRQSGEMLGIGFYDSTDAAKAFQPISEQARTRLEPYQESQGGGDELFELAASTGGMTRALVDRWLGGFNAHNPETLARLAAPDVDARAAGHRPLKGPQDVKDYHQLVFRAFPDAQLRVENVVGAAGSVVVEAIFTATHAGALTTAMGDIAPPAAKSRRISCRSSRSTAAW